MIEIVTQRFLLRPVVVTDATDRYLSWLAEASGVITVAPGDRESLCAYITERVGRSDVLFLAIVERATGRHIGNVKYEPIDREAGYAVMGILIGEADFRGRGVAIEVMNASEAWLREHAGIRTVVLGVSVDNPAAIRAYEKAGFVQQDFPRVARWREDQRLMVKQL